MSQTSVQADKKTRFPIAGSILILIAAGLSLLVAIIGMAWLYSHYNISIDIGDFNSEAWTMSLLGLFGYIFGLPSSIFSMKRIHFGFSIFGTGTVAASALLLGIYAQWFIDVICWLPILFLSLASLVFVSMSKREFS